MIFNRQRFALLRLDAIFNYLKEVLLEKYLYLIFKINKHL